jgi:hypothetical protein
MTGTLDILVNPHGKCGTVLARGGDWSSNSPREGTLGVSAPGYLLSRIDAQQFFLTDETT